MRAFTSNFSDLSGATNPKGIWSPAFLALKLALDRGEEPSTVIQALYDWLGQRGIKPSQVDAVLDLDAEAAYESLLNLISQQFNPKALPKLYTDTLRRAMQRIAATYVARQQTELDRQQARLGGSKNRFNVESATSLVSALLD